MYIGRFGLKNRKLLASENSRACNTFFEKKPHKTWKDFGISKHHMLDVVFITSKKTFKLIRGRGKTPSGIHSNQDTIMEKLHLNSISFKHTGSAGSINWK